MKTTQRLFAATILSIILATSALAGEMHTPSISPLPPPAPPPSGDGRIVATEPADNYSSNETMCAYDILTEAALLFCQKVLAVF